MLKHHGSVKMAHVYENYAELVLDSRCRPSDLLRELSGKLEIRKFQTTEPSLNSIFLEVVGSSAPAESAVAVPAQTKPNLPDPSGDRRVKKALRGVIVGIVLLFVVILAMVIRHDSSWETPGLFLLIMALSFTKYLIVRRKVKAEIRQNGSGGNAHE